jgi:hypothetical protein
MRRSVMASLVVALVLLVPTGAWARGDGWEPLPTPPDVKVACPEGPVLVHVVVNKEYVKTTTLPDGTTQLMVTGTLKVQLTNEATGESVLTNPSGPAVGQFMQELLPNGDFLFQAVGINLIFITPEQAASSGLPVLFTSSGPLQILFTSEGGVVPIRIPNHLTDWCAVLGLG